MTALAEAMELLKSQMRRTDEIIDCFVLHDDLFREIVAEVQRNSPHADHYNHTLTRIKGIPVYTAADNQGVVLEMFKHTSTANRIAFSKKTDEGWVMIEVPCAELKNVYGIWKSDPRMFISGGV